MTDGASDEHAQRVRLEGRVERLEAAVERYARLGQLLDGRWAETVGEWRGLAGEVLAAEADVEEATTRVSRVEGFEALVRAASQGRDRLGEEVTRLAREAGLAAAPWPTLLVRLAARADAAETVGKPAGAPLLVGPTPDGDGTIIAVTAVAGGLGLVAAVYGLSHFGTYGWLLGLVPAGLGAVAVGSLTLGRRFVVHGARLTRPGRAGQGLALDLSAAALVEAGGALRVEADGLGVEVPAHWEHAGFLRAIVEAARAGLLLDARRVGTSVVIPTAALGEVGGAMLGWGELVLFVSDLAAPRALAALTGQAENGLVRGRDVLALVEVLDPAQVRAGLARWKGVTGLCAWQRDQCLVSPFPPRPKRDRYDSTERDCPLEVSRGMEILTAKLTWGEAAEVASSLGLAPPE